MKIFFRFFVICCLLGIGGCTTQIQEMYWGAGTSVAIDAEKNGDIETAETELVIALKRAQNHLSNKDIAFSLFNLGSFYRRQGRLPEAIKYLQRALEKQEALSGSTSERTGRILTELAAVYLMEDNKFEGHQIASRLEQIKKLYKGNEKKFVDSILTEYKVDISEYQANISKLQPLASSGDPSAQYQLANTYMDGPDAKRIFSEILELYNSSANQGFALAQHSLGVIYDKGRGVPEDDVQARNWYKLAAENNMAISQYNYAVFLLKGWGGERNQDEAIKWFQRAEKGGFGPASRALQNIGDRTKG